MVDFVKRLPNMVGRKRRHTLCFRVGREVVVFLGFLLICPLCLFAGRLEALCSDMQLPADTT